MHLTFLVLVAVFGVLNALPFQGPIPMSSFTYQPGPPPPGVISYMRPSNLMPGAGMRMLSSTYKNPAPSSPASHYPAAPSYPGYYPPQPSHLNINNNNNNDNFNHNSEEAQARAYDESRNAQLQNQELNDILAAFSLQSFLQNSRPAPHHSNYAPAPKLKEKYSTGAHSSYGSQSGSSHHSGHSSHSSHHEKKETTKKYLKETSKDTKKDYGVPRQLNSDYTPKKYSGY